jgi:acyl carrier protein
MLDAQRTGDLDGRSEEQVEATVRAIVAELAPNKDADVRDESNLAEDLGFHSLALLELAFTLEDEFDLLPITEEDARQITTVGKVLEHVVAQLRERSEGAAA